MKWMQSFVVLMLVVSPWAFALNEAPQSFTLDGRIFSAPASTTPLLDTGTINVKILDPSGLCVLYEETQNFDTTATDGYFNVAVGSATGGGNRSGNDPNLSMEDVFQNKNMVLTPNAGCPLGRYTPTAGDTRLVRITVDPTSGPAQVFSPDMRMDSVPHAIVAESVEGLSRDNMLEINKNAQMTQAHFENVFGVTNYPRLTGLLSGQLPNTGVGSVIDANSQRVTNVSTPTAAGDAVNKTYSDGYVGGNVINTGALAAGDANKVMVWDGTKWMAAAQAGDATKLPLNGSGTMTGALQMGNQNITGTGHILQIAQSRIQVGRFTDAQEGAMGLVAGDIGSMWYNTTDLQMKAWNGVAIQELVSSTTTAGGDLTGTYPSPTIAANAVTTTKMFANPGTNFLVMTDGTTGANLVSKSCAANEVLRWNSAPGVGWECVATTSLSVAVNNVNSGAGLYFSYAPNGAVCTDGQSLIWDNSNTRWICGTSATGQWSGDGTHVWRASGRVGIGTTAPSFNLGFSGQSAQTLGLERQQTAATAGQDLTISSSGAVSGSTDLDGGSLILSAGTSTGSGASSIKFLTSPSGTAGTTDRTPTQAMVINQVYASGIATTSPRVGIGTTAPTDSLEVFGSANGSGSGHIIVKNNYNGTSSTAGLYATGSTGVIGVFGFANLAYTQIPMIPGASQYISTDAAKGISMLASNAAGVIRFGTGGTAVANERMRIDASGYVGIGTTAPQTALDIVGTGTVASAMIVPRDTTANRPSSPVEGMVRYNTSTKAAEVYSGTTPGWGSLPSQMAAVDLTGQTGAIAATTIFTPTADGMYQMCIFANITTAGTSGNLDMFITYGAEHGASKSQSLATIANISTLGNASSNCTTYYVKSGTAVQYSTTLSGAAGALNYTLHIRALRY